MKWMNKMISAPTLKALSAGAMLLVLSASASAQFLREGTHDAPVFYNEDRMNAYFVDKEWSQDPSTLKPMKSIDIPFEWAQGWIRNRSTFSRALVMGQPESCPLMAGIYGAPDQETAARIAFTSCFYQLSLLEKHQKEDCGCQLAMVDEVVFVEPGGFNNFNAAPAIVEFDDGSRETLGIVYFGEELLGQNQDIRLVDSRGRQRCEGTYSINALLFNDLNLDCDFFCEPYDGAIKIEGFRFNQDGFRPTATVTGQSCEGVEAVIRVGKMQGE